MEQNVTFGCQCGKVRGHLSEVGPKFGVALTCHCSYCRSAELHLSQPDPAPQGVTLYQTTGDLVHFDAGRDQLAGFRFNPKGLIRWHAQCCGVPLFNTMGHPGTGFASLIVARTDDPSLLGPVRAVIAQPHRSGKTRNSGLLALIVGMISRTLRMKFSGKWRDTPFFDDTGAPVTDIPLLSNAQKAALPLNR